ncbi:MAG: helix-turn-helix transcriptional regulator [Lachnospiraceae bacterium]|nr:helix-turn-helix transcriptional regulator [Lachnospiraceae bacterium]
MNNRIRLIRDELKLSRAAFGQRIGVSGDVINNLERGRVEPKESIIKLICAEFNVNEKWILNGTEPMYVATPSSTMEQLKKEFNLDEFSCNLVYEYLKLEPDQRDVVRNFFYSVVKEDKTVATSDNISSDACTVEEAEKAYIKSRSRTAKKTGQSALNTTEGGANAENISGKAANQ